ncbi:hypothetical protein HOY82DRAFT_616577 [Tuber indicum]|nr:hypothetical protein HOY82DRAFT_616577 [Tuber indicum]
MKSKNFLAIILSSIIFLHLLSVSTACPPIDPSLFHDPLTHDPTTPLHTHPRIIPRGGQLKCTTTKKITNSRRHLPRGQLNPREEIPPVYPDQETLNNFHDPQQCKSGRQTVAGYCENQGMAVGRWAFPATDGSEDGRVGGAEVPGVAS